MDDHYSLSLNIKGEALEKLLRQVLKDMDLRGLYVANSVFSDKIKEVIKCEVGHYLRFYDYDLRRMIQEEIKQSLPQHIKSAVESALEKQKQKILENLND